MELEQNHGPNINNHALYNIWNNPIPLPGSLYALPHSFKGDIETEKIEGIWDISNNFRTVCHDHPYTIILTV